MTDEAVPGSIFNYYSKDSCQFECLLRNAVKRVLLFNNPCTRFLTLICQVGCTPWNYIHLSPGTELCLRNRVEFFETNLTSFDLKTKECNYCPEDCSRVSYPAKTDTRLLDPSVECQGTDLQ